MHRLQMLLSPWLLLILSPGIWLARLLAMPSGFLFWPGSAYTDLAISHWPNAVFLATSLRTWGQVPLWNPLILSGAPFAADPLAGVWYLPTWIGGWLPGALGFNLAIAGHLALGAIGLYALLRQEGAGKTASTIGGLVFSGGTTMVSHIAAGHVGLVEAVSWTPIVLYLMRRAILEQGQLRHAIRWACWAGASAGLLFLADPRWAPPAGILTLVVAAEAWKRRLPAVRVGVLAGGTACLTAVGVAAILLFPMARLAALSTRANLPASEQAFLSLPASRLTGYLVPLLAGSPEWAVYIGLATLMLATAAVALRAPRAGLWLGVLLGAMILALGNATPIHAWVLRVLPGGAWLRVPARFLLLGSLALAMLAGLGVHAIEQAAGIAPSCIRRARLTIVACGVFAVGLGVVLGFVVGAGTAVWTGLIGFLGTGVVLFGLRPSRPGPIWLAAISLLVIVDLGAADWRMTVVRPASDVLTERGALAAWLDDHLESGQRVFSPSYSLPQQTAARLRLELADGVNPLQLRAYRDYLASATGFDSAGYSVTLPPFPEGQPSKDWSPSIDAEALGLLSVGYVVSEYPLAAPGLGEASRIDGAYVYRNAAARPRAWVERPPAGTAHWATVEDLRWSPNHIGVVATGPGSLVLSEVVYPGWRAKVDGVEVGVTPAHDVLRSVALPAGRHAVEFFYRDGMTAAAGLISLLTWLLLLLGVRRW